MSKEPWSQRDRLHDAVRLSARILELVLLQVVIGTVLFSFPFIVLLLGVKILELMGRVLWPGGF